MNEYIITIKVSKYIGVGRGGAVLVSDDIDLTKRNVAKIRINLGKTKIVIKKTTFKLKGTK